MVNKYIRRNHRRSDIAGFRLPLHQAQLEIPILILADLGTPDAYPLENTFSEHYRITRHAGKKKIFKKWCRFSVKFSQFPYISEAEQDPKDHSSVRPSHRQAQPLHVIDQAPLPHPMPLWSLFPFPMFRFPAGRDRIKVQLLHMHYKSAIPHWRKAKSLSRHATNSVDACAIPSFWEHP